MNRLITAALLVFCSVSFSQNVNSLWKSSSINRNSKSITKTGLPLKHLFDLDLHSLKNKLASSPKRNAPYISSNTVISLPNGEGNIENFIVYENSVMDAELAAKYPEIKSYVAVGIDNPSARAYFSNSPLGFKSMTIYPDKSTVFIEPITADLNTYTIYKKSDKEASQDQFECSVMDFATNNIQKTKKTSVTSRNAADDGKLRTFRLALSCTAEYAAFFGGTKALALAGMNNTLTRINGIFEKDFGVQLILIANNDAVIYTNPTTDPYSDYASKSNWRTELKTNLNTTIGLANYDIGHLLGAGTVNSGDAGGIGSICNDFNKGSGYTCANSGAHQGDAFDVEYVAHEMGHQLGAYHTFTYKSEAGTGAQMEPGDGSTIMSYGGLSMKAFQNNPDSYFHAISIQQVNDIVKTKTCCVLISTGNAMPIVNAGLDYSIPKGTPFLLTGSATDANNDVLTYTWEQMDLGDATNSVPNATSIAGPLFRSFTPSTSPNRYLPNLTTILSGSTTTLGTFIPSEVLPGVARNLKFRLTVRDNRAGGSTNSFDDMVITVDGNSGPFTVDSQNSAVTYTASSTQTINWTVAGTNSNGVNCATVDILLSTDGGNTFTIPLLSATPNIGSAQVLIPNIPGTTNRIMVKGTNHIFFDINNTNFTITSTSETDTIAPTASTLSVANTTFSSTDLSWTAATDNSGVIGYNVYQNGVLKTTTTLTSLSISDLSASTGYSFYVVAKDAAENLSPASNIVNITTVAAPDTQAPTAPTLSASNTTISSVDLSWSVATDNVGVIGYNVYQNGVLKTITSSTSLSISDLSASTAYSFYVVAKDAAGNLSNSSNIANITTLAPPDTQAPTAPTLSAANTTISSTELSWTAASDNVGVIGYNVYQNGVLKTTTTSTSSSISDLSTSTAYSFYVVAKDAAGNLSVASNIVNLTTLAPPDTQAPTASTLSATNTTISSVDLSWSVATDNVGVIGYNVYQNGVLKTITTSTSLSISDLSASTGYNFYVVAKDAAGNLSAVSNTVNITTLNPPDTLAPTTSTLSATNTGISNTDLSWTAASDNVGVIGYNVYQNGVLKTITSSTSLSISDLSASTGYSFYVVAKDAAGNLSSASNIANITTVAAPDTQAPTAPTLSASNTTISSTYLSWTAASDNVGIIGYNVYQNGVLKTTTTSTSLSISDLSASTGYSFYVVAKDAAGNLSTASNIVNLTTLAPPDTQAPTAPTLSASNTTISSVDLSWSVATDNIEVIGYNVYQNGVLKTTTTSTSLSISDLSASTAYSFYVVAKDAAGNLSSASNIANITTVAAPDTQAPTAPTLSASNTTISSVDLSWTAATDNVGVIGYNVYQNGVLKTTTTSTSSSISDLLTSTAYSFYVVAKDAAGNLSSASNIANITTVAAPDTQAPTAPTLSASNTTISSVDLSWTAATDNVGVIGYNVYQNGVLKTTTTLTSLSISDLSTSTAYSFSVVAKDAAGNLSNSSNIAKVTTLSPEGKTLSTNSETLERKPTLKLYPNPVKGDMLNISNLEESSNFRIFNMMGQEIERNHIENNAVYVGSLRAGVYLIEITNDSSTTTKQFIKG